MNIHLLGDSLVQTKQPGHGKFYCGWGDWLSNFVLESVKINNYSLGGRSVRRFLNEGRFFDNGIFNEKLPPYNMGPALPKIQKDDYVLIQFMCNDDDSGEITFRRDVTSVALGKPDSRGIYPTIIPEAHMKTSSKIFEEKLRNSSLTEVERRFFEECVMFFGDEYYPYNCGATYKGYLKYYTDKIREKGAFPILVTSPPKHIFIDKKLLPANGFLGGNDDYNDFTYVEAMKQLGEAENVLVIDLFEPMKAMYEELGEELSSYFHNIVVSVEDFEKIDAALISEECTNNTDWCQKYDSLRKNNKFLQLDRVHFNYFGAYIQAALVADKMMEIKQLSDYIISKGKKGSYIPEQLSNSIAVIEKQFKNVQIKLY